MDKQEINRVIAEAMDLDFIADNFDIWYLPTNRDSGWVKAKIRFNSMGSISDAMEAVDKILTKPQVEITFYRYTPIRWSCQIWYYRSEFYTAEAETPEAAMSLALVEYIKEKK